MKEDKKQEPGQIASVVREVIGDLERERSQESRIKVHKEQLEKSMMDSLISEAQEQTQLSTLETKRKVNKLIKYNSFGSMGIGLIPIPMLDMAALSGQQLIMIKKIADYFGVPYSRDIGKSIIASLLGSVIPLAFSGTIASMIKFIPIIGSTVGALTMPVISGASTYAMGHIFAEHFAEGGTLQDLDPNKVREEFLKKFEEGNLFVKNSENQARKAS